MIRIASPPSKPVLVFDGDCNFCRRWISRWREATGERIEYVPFQHPSVAERFPELPREQCEQAVQLIDADGAVHSSAEAVFRALAFAPQFRWPLWLYQHVPGVAPGAEFLYRFVAKHRTGFSLLTRFLWGQHVEEPTYLFNRWLFLRFLGLIYLVAFISLWTQVDGLIGSHGIAPAAQFMEMVRNWAGEHNRWDAHLIAPTLCWFSASDAFLHFLCAGGTVLSVLLIFGIAPAPVLALLWLFYLSLSVVSDIFLGYQWDALLLETGLLAIFFAPLQLRPRLTREAPPSRTMLWLLRWLLFRLMFASGVVKLAAHDPTWRGLTALTYHYETQPLPTWIGWYAHQCPVWFQKFSCGVMFAIELGAPFLIFAPRRSALRCRSRDHNPDDLDRRHRELLFLQSAHRRAVRSIARRCRASAIRSFKVAGSAPARRPVPLVELDHQATGRRRDHRHDNEPAWCVPRRNLVARPAGKAALPVVRLAKLQWLWLVRVDDHSPPGDHHRRK